MPKVRQQKATTVVRAVLKKEKISIKNITSAKAFEKALLKFLKEENVLHLCTCKNKMPRATPLEYRLHGLTFYILSEGGSKFNNLKLNKNVSFSIAAPYDSNKDFWGSKGVQAWGKAKVYSRKTDPSRVKEAQKHMMVTLQQDGIQKILKGITTIEEVLRVTES
jgi:hypothetical protein